MNGDPPKLLGGDPRYRQDGKPKNDQNKAGNFKQGKNANPNVPEIIPTPSFELAEIPQPRIVTDTPQDLSLYLSYHKPLEILERRIRGDFHRYECATESVAELYTIMPDFEPEPHELGYEFTYYLPRDENHVPTFWEHRVYDLPEEMLSEESSKELKDEIDERMKIVIVQKSRRMDWREQKKLLRIVQESEEKKLEEENRKPPSEYPDPLPPDQRKKRKNENLTMRIQWLRYTVLTDSTDDETEPDDFVL